MKRIKNYVLVLAVLMMSMSFTMTAYADSVSGAGGTGQGNITGTNVYTFSYIYDGTIDAIVLKVDTTKPVKAFGNTCTHTFGPGDTTTLNTNYPQLGSSLESAIATMNAYGGYNLSPDAAKATLQAMGYFDKGNGVWKYDGGYLTYVSAAKIRPQNHTVSYDANGGSGAPSAQTKYQGTALTLSSTKPTRTGYTFVNWTASIGGNYAAGGSYTHDQDGGTVTMKANWTDSTAPSCSSFGATPTSWSSGNGSVSLTVQDKGSGLASITLQRYSYVTKAWSDVGSWTCSNTTSAVTKTYTETNEGTYLYKLTAKDAAGNTTTKTSDVIYLDHSNPVISGKENTVTDWTNVVPSISVSATDYLSGTSYGGSGLASLTIYDESGAAVSSGTTSTSYTLEAKYEGVHSWTITAIDNVGHSTSVTLTTKYDMTKPYIEGTEVEYVTPDGITVSGYCQDNIIDQHMDDYASHSANSPNTTSGIKSVILYKVTASGKTVIYGDTTKKTFAASDTNSYFDMYYQMPENDKNVKYYLIMVEDFAGNVTKKKLVSQQSMLTWFHTSIDRGSYR